MLTLPRHIKGCSLGGYFHFNQKMALLLKETIENEKQ